MEPVRHGLDYLANVDVDATGPGTSLGTDADGAPRTCGDLPALPGCIPRLVRSLDDAADRHRVPNDRTLPKRPGGTSGIFRNTGKHHFLPRMATAATPENPDGSCSLPHHPGAPHPSRGSRSRATRFQSTALADGGHAGREPIIRSRPEIPLRPGASRIGILPTIKPPDIYPDRSQSPDRTMSGGTGEIKLRFF